MKLILILTTLCSLTFSSCSFGGEDDKIAQIIPEASLLKIVGSWEVINFEGEDVDDYKEVIERVVIKFEKNGSFTMTVTYKKNALIQFQGIQEMSPDGRVVSTGNLVMKEKAIKMIVKGYEDDASTISFRNGNLITKDDDEDASFVYKRIAIEKKPTKKQNKSQ